MDIKEIISQAVFNEDKAFIFYKLMADRASFETSRILFNHLAKEELQHKQILLKHGIDFEFLGSSKDIKILEKLMLTPVNEMGNLKLDLKNAVKKEEASFKTYTVFSKNTSGDTKTMFEKLAREEERHMNMLKSELERL